MEINTTVQWYPGHMAKAKKAIKKDFALVDLTIEVIDARIPESSRNPDFEDILSKKPRVIVLNKKDLAEDKATNEWLSYYRSLGYGAVAVNSNARQGIKELIQAVRVQAEPLMLALEAKGRRRRPIRVLVVGIPNVGKSTVINAITGKVAAKTGNKPGVTKGPQWVRILNDIELLDTPGVLWPKFDDPQTGMRLAATGAVSDLVFSLEDIAYFILKGLVETNPAILRERFKLGEIPENPLELLELIGRKRGFLAPGGLVKTEQTAVMVLSEFRGGKLGRNTLERVR